MARFKYRLKEQAEKNVEEFQTKRIESFDDLEKRIEALVPKLRKAKIASITKCIFERSKKTIPRYD